MGKLYEVIEKWEKIAANELKRAIGGDWCVDISYDGGGGTLDMEYFTISASTRENKELVFKKTFSVPNYGFYYQLDDEDIKDDVIDEEVYEEYIADLFEEEVAYALDELIEDIKNEMT